MELTLISQLANLTQVALQNVQRAELLLLVFDDGLRRDHLLGNARGDEDKILLGYLHAALLGVELADADALAHLAQLELLGLVARKLDHVQPGHIGPLLPVALEHARRAVEQALESLDQDGPQRAGAEVAGHALVAVQDALVVAEQREDVGQGVIVCEQRQVDVAVAGEVVDLQVVARLGGLVGGSGMHVVVRRAALALEVLGELSSMVVVVHCLRGGGVGGRHVWAGGRTRMR